MKTKNIWKILITLFSLLLFLSGCNSDDPIKTGIERANNFETISDLYSSNEYSSYYYKNYTDEDEELLSNKCIDFLFGDDHLNGIYYYNEKFVSGLYGSTLYGEECSDTIGIYVVSKDEIYVFPKSIIGNDEISSILNNENKEDYKYYALNGGCADSSWKNDRNIGAEMKPYNGESGVSLDVYEDDGHIEIMKNFYYQKGEDGEDILPYGRDYYLDKETSISVAESNYEKTLASKQANKDALSETKEKCSFCNGTGYVKYYYGSSTLEAYLTGHDDYTFGRCTSCNGTGYKKD